MAGAGSNNMRVQRGSYVDSKAWNIGIGWAHEEAAKSGVKHRFSPFVEYRRDDDYSYLDNGSHGSGKINYLGIGVMGKLAQKDGMWLEASACGGRAACAYRLHGEDAAYDGSNTYYSVHLGMGKTYSMLREAVFHSSLKKALFVIC